MLGLRDARDTIRAPISASIRIGIGLRGTAVATRRALVLGPQARYDDNGRFAAR